MGQMYRSLRDANPELMTIVELDEFIFDIGFEQTEVNAGDHPIPADRAFYIVRPAELSLERKEDFEHTTASVPAVVRRLLKVSCCLCVGVHRSTGVVAVLISQGIDVADLHDCLEGIRALFVAHGFPSAVFSYPEHHDRVNGSRGGPCLPLLNRYAVLVDQGEEELHERSEAVAVDNNAAEDGEHIVMNPRPKRVVRITPTVRCNHREFCRNASKCKFLHTEQERQLFGSVFARPPYTMRKTVLCSNSSCNRGRSCHYRHQGEAAFCTRCPKYPCMGAPCNDSYERSCLAPKEVIVDLKNKGYIAV